MGVLHVHLTLGVMDLDLELCLDLDPDLLQSAAAVTGSCSGSPGSWGDSRHQRRWSCCPRFPGRRHACTGGPPSEPRCWAMRRDWHFAAACRWCCLGSSPQP